MIITIKLTGVIIPSLKSFNVLGAYSHLFADANAGQVADVCTPNGAKFYLLNKKIESTAK